MTSVNEYYQALKAEIAKIFIGKDERIDLILMSVFTGGHVLLNDLPGSGKTTLVKTLAMALGLDWGRIQFTPDLMPSDIIGMTVFNQKTLEFEHLLGPIHTNLLLADEINRAIPRTQSALLEAMEEGQVTTDGETIPLPQPFIVLATENPIEKESTFELPAAQTDRFMISLSLGYPSPEEEIRILSELGDRTPFEIIRPVTDKDILLRIHEEISAVRVSDHILRYIVSLVERTRSHPLLSQGGSPRASRSLYQGAKARAAMLGRDYVTPEDIQTIWHAVMNHRLSFTAESRMKLTTLEEVLDEILDSTEVPPLRQDLFHAR